MMKTKQKDFKSPPNHMQVVIDGLQLLTFTLYDQDSLKDVITDLCGQVDFYGNKIRKEDKEHHTAWVDKFKEVCKAIEAFVLMNLAKLSNWSGKEDSHACEEYFDSIVDAALKGEVCGSNASQATAPAKPSAP